MSTLGYFFFKHSQVKIVKNVKRCDGSGHFACGDIFHLTHTSLPKSAFGKFCFFLHHFQFNKEKRRDYGSRAILASRLKHFPILWEHYSAALMWLFTTETSAKSCNKSFESGPSVPNLDVKVFVTKLCNCSLLEFENLWFCIKKKTRQCKTINLYCLTQTSHRHQKNYISSGIFTLLFRTKRLYNCILLLVTDYMSFTFDLKWCVVIYFWWQIICWNATISSYVKCTFAQLHFDDRSTYSWLSYQENAKKILLAVVSMCTTVQSNNCFIWVSVCHVEKLGRGQKK